MSAGIQDMFEQAGCAGQLCVQSLAGTQEVAVEADRPVVSASVFKVCVALEAETQFAAGRLDPRERVTLRAASRTPRTTPRDMAVLLRLIWSDHAGAPQACHRVRQLMGHQLTKHRLAAAFLSPARVSAKSGSLVGVIRNEIGVIEYPDGRGYAAAVFARAHRPWQNDAAINAAIGTTAAAAIGTLHD
jgi:beta-lactamase class A